jgi:nucleotide-binding universal stress UspA family protein
MASVLTSWCIIVLKETLMPIQHMLVPLDFSPYAEQALKYAIDLAQTLRAHLTLLHVIHLTPLAMGDMLATSLEAYLQAVETEAEEQMHAARARVHQVGLRCDTLIVQGVPFQIIVDTAGDRDVDLIVMGTHGRTGLTHVLMGSVAEKVVRLAPCPVLVTRGSTDAPTA